MRWWDVKLSKIKRYLFQSKGNTAIEFAIIAPAFFILFIGIFEVGSIMLVRTSLETAVFQASRFGRTGGSNAGETPTQTAISLVNTYSFGLVDPSKLVLTVTPYTSFAAMPLLGAAPTSGTQNFGTANQAVLYTLSYNWTFFTPLVGRLLSTNGTSIPLTASAVVQNEPF